MAPAERLPVPCLRDVLDTVAEFETASIGLVAWELCLPEETVAPAWQEAIADGLLEEVGRCSETSEMMFQLVSVAVAGKPAAREPAAG
jgi:hypothetical protein